MYRGAQGSQKSCGAMALPLAHPMTVLSVLTANLAGVLTSQSVGERFLGRSSGVPGKHQKDCRVYCSEGLHQVERNEKTDSGRSTWRDGDQNDSPRHVDDGESDHGEQSLIPFGDDETGISIRLD